MSSEVTFKYGTMVEVSTETGVLEIFVEQGTEVSKYDLLGPDKDGMVKVSFPLKLGETRAIFTGRVAESVLSINLGDTPMGVPA